MRLSRKTTVKLNDKEANILGHMCYAAYKLWNVCNYEWRHYIELGLEEYPDWYYQKKNHKDDLWYRSLPSQTAQEVCKLLDKSWKSYYALLKTKGIENPNPPRFKQEPIAVTYMQKGILHIAEEKQVRLSLPKKLKGYMKSEYGIEDNYLYLENPIFQETDAIKQIRLYPPVKGEAEVIVVYEAEEPEQLEENEHYLSIDLGLHNLLTCYDSDGTSFIAGRKYLNLTHRYYKEIARVQSQWGKIQASKGTKYPKSSAHIQKLYRKKENAEKDYLHKVTRYIAEYCHDQDIRTVVIGDIHNIRKNNDHGRTVNQKLHSLPYAKLYGMLEYKLKLYGIQMIKENEAYTSQCSPKAKEISSEYADKANRINRGLYREGKDIYNADATGAYNILRKYLKETGKDIKIPMNGLSSPLVVKAAV